MQGTRDTPTLNFPRLSLRTPISGPLAAQSEVRPDRRQRLEAVHREAIETLSPKFLLFPPPAPIEVLTAEQSRLKRGEHLAIIIEDVGELLEATKSCASQTGLYLHMKYFEANAMRWENYPALGSDIHLNRIMVPILCGFSYFESNDMYKELSSLRLSNQERTLSEALGDTNVDQALAHALLGTNENMALLRKWRQLTRF